MGLKEKMMDSMLGKMSPEEKKAMMDRMMTQFLGNMTPEEKQAMMQEMMPKMMGQMMGGGGMMGGMMEMMMGHQAGGENPMSMCQKMMANISRSSDLATFATPEIRGLFEDWIRQIEEELHQFVAENKTADPRQIADHFKISEASAVYLLSKLAQEGRVSMKVERKA